MYILPVTHGGGGGMHSLRVGGIHHKQPMTWQDYVDAVAKAAAKRPTKAHGGTIDPARRPGAETLSADRDLYRERRCQHVSARTGARCRKWAMVGATRCHYHGGYRERPDHPATVRLYRRGVIDAQDAHIRARPLVYARGRELERDAARRELRARGLAPHNVEILAGMDAYAAGDGGRSWRRWLATLDAKAR